MYENNLALDITFIANILKNYGIANITNFKNVLEIWNFTYYIVCTLILIPAIIE